VTFDRVMPTMNRDATTITAAHETTGARITFEDPGMTGRLVHHRGVEIIVTTCTFHYGRVQCHAKIVAAITERTISTTIAAIEDRKSGSNKHHVKTAVTSATTLSSSRLRGGSR